MALTGYSMALTGLLALAIAPAACADLIKQGSVYNRDILVVDTTGANVNGLASGAFAVKQSLAGGAYAAVTPTITYKLAGHYNVAYTAAMTATLGGSSLVITAAGAAQTDVSDQIVAFDPQDASLLGLTGVATAGSQSTIQAKTVLIGTNGGDSPNEQTAQGRLDVTVSSRQPSGPVTVSNLPAFPANFAQFVISSSGAVTTSNPTTGDTPGTTTLLSRIPGVVQPQTGDAYAAAGGIPAATLLALNADALYSKLVHHQMGKFTYNPATRQLQLLLDDGATALGSPLTLTIDSGSNTTARQ